MVFYLSCDRTRSVQKLLKYVTTKEQITLIMRALSPGVVALSKNSNGQHVIEHCLEHFSVQDNEVCSLLFRRFAIIRIFCSCCIWSRCFASSAHVIFMMSYILQESPFSNCF